MVGVCENVVVLSVLDATLLYRTVLYASRLERRADQSQRGSFFFRKVDSKGLYKVDLKGLYSPLVFYVDVRLEATAGSVCVCVCFHRINYFT